MPSHSIKQAKVMSAIAHGWKPKGSAKGIPVKVAKEFHAADAGHKYGKGMKRGGAVEKALRLAKKAKDGVKEFARGGEIDINDTFDPTEGGQIPKPLQQAIRVPPRTWTTQPQRYAEGGETDDRDLPLADPTFKERWYDRAAGAYAAPKPAYGMDKALFQEGKARNPEEKDWTPYGSFGELKGTAPEDTPTAIRGRNGLNITEGDIDRGMNVGMGGGPGIMVGPYGAFMLRQAGTAARPHPVYAKEVEENAKRLRPEFRDAYRRWQEDARDAEARRVLTSREKNWDARDNDVWKGSGWFRGADGYMRKEIPDYGATLKEVLPGKYALEHPAGDFHKIYDIPPMEFDPSMPVGEAAAFTDTGRIVLGGNPKSKKDVKGAISPALHEVQHIIQSKEGFSGGANPNHMGRRPELEHEFFPTEEPATELGIKNGNIMIRQHGGEALEPSWQAERYGHKFDNAEVPRTAFPPRELVARQETYKNAAGETESRNVQDRFAKGFRYHLHPEDTESVSRGLQWHDTQHIARPREEVLKDIRESSHKKRPWAEILRHHIEGKAGGGGVGNFNPERASAYGLARQGMIKSSIPGRTDKINMKVPTGSYIIPADIPSAIGEGNSDAGGNILGKMLNKGPYGMNLPKRKGGMRVGKRKASLSMTFAEGGDVEDHTPIVAAGGEFVVYPDAVAHLGGGDIDLGHAILDDFVKQIRDKNIQTLSTLKPPKGSE